MHHTIQKAGKVLTLFNLNRSSVELTAAEMARQLNEPSSSMHDLLHSMVDVGLLELTGKSRYRLGWELVRLGHLRYSYTQCHAEIATCLEQLVKETALGAHYSLLEGDAWVVIAFMLGTQYAGFTSASNTFSVDGPMFWTAGGRVLWADQPWEHVEQAIAKHGLGANLPNLTSLSLSYRQDLERVRLEGFAERIDGEERTLAVPVFHQYQNKNDPSVIGAMTLFGPTQAFDIGPPCRDRLMQASQQLSNQLRTMDDPYATVYPNKPQ